MWPAGRGGKVLFYAESPVKWAMFRPIRDRIGDDPRVRFWFAGQLRGEASSRRMARALGVRGATPIARGLAALFRFDAVVTADYEVWSTYRRRPWPIRSSPRIQIFHGVSARNGAIQPAMRTFDRLFLVGPYMRRRFVESGIFREDDPRLLNVGMPKTDRLVDGSLDRDAILAAYGLDPERPTVMLAPTWVRSSPLFDWGEELLETLADGPWNLIVKLHDKFLDVRFNVVDWRARLLALDRRPNVAAVVDEYDATPALFASDVLISDLSSISHEFTLLDRPLVFLQVPRLDRLREQYPQLDVETWGPRTGRTVVDAAGCRRAVEAALADPTEGSEVRRAAAADLFFHPGRASEVAARALLSEIGLEP